MMNDNQNSPDNKDVKAAAAAESVKDSKEVKETNAAEAPDTASVENVKEESQEAKEVSSAESVEGAPEAKEPAATEEVKKDPEEIKEEPKETVAAESVEEAPEIKEPVIAEEIKEEQKETVAAESVEETPETKGPVTVEETKEEPKEAKEAAAAECVEETQKSEDAKIADINAGHARRKIIASVFASAGNEQDAKETPVAENVKGAQDVEKIAADESDALPNAQVKDIKSEAASHTKEKIIVAAVLLAGVWSVFFAVFSKNLSNLVSLKNSASEVITKTGPANKTKKLPGKKYKKAKDFTLTDLDGKIVKFANLRGKVVFIDFWASWCPPCKMSVPAVKKLHEKMKNNPNVVVLSINCWEEKKKASNFVKKEGITYPVLFSDGVVEKDYKVESIPRFFIIDGDGNIINEYSGWHPSYAANWEDDINEALSLTKPGESAPKQPQQPPLSDLDGNAVDIAAYKGKTVFLAFWIMQSYACVKAQPAFNVINAKVSRTANAEFFGVNADTQQSLLKTFVKDNNIKYPVLRATQNFADSYGVSSAYPACVIIDKNGKTAKTFYGYSDGDEKEWVKAFNEVVKAK